MKRTFLGLVAILFLCLSCGGETQDKDEANLESAEGQEEVSADAVTLTAEAKEALLADPEIKEYFEALEASVDAYIKIMEDLAKTGVDMEASGNENDLSHLMKGLGNMADNTQKFAESAERVKALKEKSETIKQALSERDAKVFALMYASIMAKYLKMAENVDNYAEEKRGKE